MTEIIVEGELRAQIFPTCEKIVGTWDYMLDGEQHHDAFVAVVPAGDACDFDRNNFGQVRCTAAGNAITTQALCILAALQAKGATNIKYRTFGKQLWH